MSINGLQQTYVPNSLDGLTYLDVDGLTIDGQEVDLTTLVPYSGADKPFETSYPIRTTYAPAVASDVVNLVTLQNAIGYVEGITAANFVKYTGSTQDVDLGTYKISSSAAPTSGNQLTNKSYVDGQDALRVPYSGATSTVALNSQNITTSHVPAAGPDLTNKSYVDTAIATTAGTLVPYVGSVYDLDLNGNDLIAYTARFTNVTVGAPTNYLGIDGSGNLRSVAPLIGSNNTWTGTQTFSNTVSISPATATPTFTLGINGSNQIVKYTPSSGGTISGSVSAGYVPYASSANTLANSIISQTSGQISVAGKVACSQVNLTGITIGDAGLQSELTNILNLNLNFRGTTTTAERGVGLRLDGRPAENPFQFYYRVPGTTTDLTTMVISSAGSVGIGTGAPSQKLDVSGDGARIQVESNTANNAVVQMKTNANTSYLFTDQTGHLQIYPGTSGRHVLLLPPNGNVGIGTATPAYKLDIQGSMRVRNGDSSICVYGPNSTYNATLIVGSGVPLASGPAQASIQVSNGNLHLDAGNSTDIYYGYNAAVTNSAANAHRFYGSQVFYASGLPQNGDTYAQVCVLSGTQLCKSQAVIRQVVVDPSESWAGGSLWNYAFYRYNGLTSQMIMGRLSYYQSGAGTAAYIVRVYSQQTGQTWTFYITNFTNVTYNHITVPFFCVFNQNFTTATGWFDLYIYNASGCITDGNDILDIHVITLPVSAY